VSADVAIRAASQEDAERLAVLLTELGYPVGGAEVSQRLAYWLPDPASRVLVAGRGGRVVGCISVHAISQGYIDVCNRSGRFTKELGRSARFPVRAVSAQHLPRSGVIRIGLHWIYRTRVAHKFGVSDIGARGRQRGPSCAAIRQPRFRPTAGAT
jgi:hypothetical protein